MRLCLDCPADISDRHKGAELCRPCAHKRIAARGKAWYNAHADLTGERQRAWKQNNPGRHKASNARWRARHPRRTAKFTHCQMPDCRRPLEARQQIWCRRCAPFVKATNREAWRQKHIVRVRMMRRLRKVAA